MSRDCLEQFVSDCTAKFIPWSLILVLFTLMVIVLVFAGAKAEPVPRHIVHVFTGITFGVIGVWLIALFYQHVKKKMRAEIRSPVFPSDRNMFGQAQVLEKQQQREDERRNALEVLEQPPLQQQYTSRQQQQQQQQQPRTRTDYGPRYDLEQQTTRQRQPGSEQRPQSPGRQRHVPRTAGPRQMPHHGARAPSRGRQLPGPCDARTNLDRPSPSIQQTPEHIIGTSRSRTRAASRPARHPASRSRRRDKRRSQSESTVASPTPPGGFDYRHPRSRTRDRRDDDAELFMTVPRARRNDVESLRDSVGPASPGAASMDTEERMAITVSYTTPTQRPREVETSRAQQLTSLKPHPLRVPKRSGAQPSAIDELPSQRGLAQPSTSRAGGGHDNAGPSRLAETEAWEARTESPVLPHRVSEQQQPQLQPQPAQTDVGDPPRRQPALTFDEMDVGSGREPLRNAWLTKATEGFKSALRPSKNGSSLASSRD